MYHLWDKKTNKVRPASLQEWGQMIVDIDSKRVAFDTVDNIDISTVFLGIDHGWGEGPPLLFETMCFGPEGCPWGDFQLRYSSPEDALNTHQSIVETIRLGLTPSHFFGENDEEN